MTWTIASSLLIFSSVCMYLAIRYLRSKQITNRQQSFYMFVPVALLFRGLYFVYPSNIRYGRAIFISMLFIYTIGSWIWNKCSVVWMNNSPNPWYSLMLSKSYVVISSTISVLLFGSHLWLSDSIAILMILWFWYLIIDNTNTKVNKWNNRILPSIGALLSRSLLALSSVYYHNIGIHSNSINLRVFTIVSILLISEWLVQKQHFYIPHTGKEIWATIILVLSSFLFNRSTQVWYSLSPNPWYINAANASSIALLTICCSLLFKDELSRKKIIGIIWVIVGISILFIF